jgi:hypothetical protein
MTKEFKKITNKNETRYVLETVTAGATSSASIPSAPVSDGAVIKRTTEADAPKVPQKPRQGHLRQQTGGGKHRDKKREQKGGQEKHRKPFAEQHASTSKSTNNKNKVEGFEEPSVPGGRWTYSGHQIIANNKTPNGSFLVLKNKNDGKYEIHKQVGSRTPGGLEFVGAYTTPEETEAAFKEISGGVEIGVAEGLDFDTDQMVSFIYDQIKRLGGGNTKDSLKDLLKTEKMPLIVQSNPELFDIAFDIAYKRFFHIDPPNNTVDYTDWSMHQGEMGRFEKGRYEAAEGFADIVADSFEKGDKVEYHQGIWTVLDKDPAQDTLTIAKEIETVDALKVRKAQSANINERHVDHEISMSRSELYSIAKNSMALFKLLSNRSEMEGLEAWQQSKITKAADYLNAVHRSLTYDEQYGDDDHMGVSEADKPLSYHDELRRYDDRQARGIGRTGGRADDEILQRSKNYEISFTGPRLYFDVSPDKEKFALSIQMRKDKEGKWYLPTFHDIPQEEFADRVQRARDILDQQGDYKEAPKGIFSKGWTTEGKIKGADGKACWPGKRHAGTKNGKDICVPVGEDNYINSLMNQLYEKAPPGEKYERMVNHIKAGYSKDGKLTDVERSKAYGAAWKAKNKNK